MSIDGLLTRLHNKTVRDLAWSCFGQPLFTDVTDYCEGSSCCNFELTQARCHWLMTLDKNPTALIEHLETRETLLLGLYFEALLEFFFLQDKEFRLLAKNLQVTAEKQTLGEFDFLYFCERRQQTIHLEVTVKFYLGFALLNTQDLCDWSRWCGPNCIDRLDLKLAKTFKRQTRLSQSVEARNLLSAKGIAPPQSEVAICGYLFYPLDSSRTPPQGANLSHQQGSWYSLSELTSLTFEAALRFEILAKQDWLSPRQHSNHHERLQGAQHNQDRNVSPEPMHWPAMKRKLLQMLEPLSKPIMVVALQNRDAVWLEQQRFFVVPDTWPSRRINR